MSAKIYCLSKFASLWLLCSFPGAVSARHKKSQKVADWHKTCSLKLDSMLNLGALLPDLHSCQLTIVQLLVVNTTNSTHALRKKKILSK